MAQTADYRSFVEERIEKGQRASSAIGNLYTASIFMALMSSLESDLQDGNELDGKRIGFFAYGSGSKSKVFEGVVQTGWQEVVRRFTVFDTLNKRTPVDYDTYDKLHRGQPLKPVLPPSGEFVLANVGTDHAVIGLRTYKWVEKTPAAILPQPGHFI